MLYLLKSLFITNQQVITFKNIYEQYTLLIYILKITTATFLKRQNMTSFQTQYQGRFVSALRWHQLDTLWERLRQQPTGWYIYFIGETLPESPVDAEQLQSFIHEVDDLLRNEHDHDFCGIVYANDMENPTMIKIYDPNNLGSSCGSAGYPIVPRWLLSKMKPESIVDQMPTPMNRKRWWHKLNILSQRDSS